MRIRTFFAASFVLFLGAGTATAGTLTVAFDLASSTLALADPAPRPLVGSVSGLALLTLMNVDMAGIPLGPDATAQVTGFSLNSALFALPGRDSNIIDHVGFVQGGRTLGAFDGSSMVFTSPLSGTLVSVIFCQGGPECAGVPVVSTAQPFANGPGFDFTLTRIGQPGAARFEARPFTLPTLQTTLLTVRGTEVARGFVPEPSTAGLLVLGMASLLLARRRRRGREDACGSRT